MEFKKRKESMAMSKATEEYLHQKQSFFEQKSQISDDLAVKLTVRKQLLARFDLITIKHGDTSRIEIELKELEREIAFLQRKQATLANKDALNHFLQPYLHAVLKEHESKMQSLRGQWEILKDQIAQAKEVFFSLLDEGRKINEQVEKVQHEYGKAQEHLDHPQYLPGPIGDEVLCDLHKGLIFWDNMEIVKRFIGKRIAIRNRRRN